jgi:hypothetical protein
LGKETRVAEPGDADLVGVRQRHAIDDFARLAWGENRGDQDFTDELEIPLSPALGWAQADLVAILRAA